MKMLTMDSRGYVDDPSVIMDYVFRHFFVANYSQTNVFYGKINSLPWLIARHAEDMFGLRDGIKYSLETMFESYFDTVTVDVEINPKNDATDIDQIITIRASVTRGIYTYDAGRLLSVVGNKISKIEHID